MHFGEQRGRARRTDGSPTDDGIEKAHGCAIRVLEQGRRDGQGGGFAPIERGQSVGGGIIPDEESTTSEARRLRLDQPQNRLHGHQRIRRGAAFGQNIDAGLHGKRIGGGHHVVLRRHR